MYTINIVSGDFPGRWINLDPSALTFHQLGAGGPVAHVNSITNLVELERSDGTSGCLLLLISLVIPFAGLFIGKTKHVTFTAFFKDGRVLVGTMEEGHYQFLALMASRTTDPDESEEIEYAEPIEEDPLYPEAVAFVRQERWASISILQNRFSIDAPRASDLFKRLQENGIVEPPGPLGQSKIIE